MMKYFHKNQLQARHILFLFLLNITFTISAGNDQGEDFHRIQVGVNFSPDNSYRILTGDSYDIDRRNETEKARFGYTGGLAVNFNLNKVFGIESGIQYSDKGFSGKNYWHVDGDDDYYEWWQKEVHHFHYIEIPLKARFVTGERKVRFSGSIGVTTGFLVGVATTTKYSDDRKTRTKQNDAENYNRLNFFFSGSMGIDYKITQKSSIRIEPTFQYGLLSTIKSKDNDLSEHLCSVGVNISYLIGIK